MAHHRAAPGDLPVLPRSRPKLWLACWQGRLPAEILPTRDREDLVWHLASAGWTDREIAEHTCMTEYTTARIRARLGLAPNDTFEEAA